MINTVYLNIADLASNFYIEHIRKGITIREVSVEALEKYGRELKLYLEQTENLKVVLVLSYESFFSEYSEYFSEANVETDNKYKQAGIRFNYKIPCEKWIYKFRTNIEFPVLRGIMDNGV